MARCRYCGWWAGLFSSTHDRCLDAFRSGHSVEEITTGSTRTFTEFPAIQVVSVRAREIAAGIFVGMWLFSISAAIVWLLIRSLLGN